MNDKSKYSILCVDDEDIITTVLKDLLKTMGYEAQVENCPLKALKVLKENDIDILISDITMPGMNGIKLMEQALIINKHTVVIMCTGMSEIETAIKCIKMGALDFLEKPIDIDRLRKTLDSAVEKIDFFRSDKAEESANILLDKTMSFPMFEFGNIIGNYKLIRILGTGSHGSVFLVEDQKTNATYALKVLQVIDKETRKVWHQRFIHEATAISQLNHPNIIEFIEFDYLKMDDFQYPYIILEYFEGESLSYYLDHGTILDFEDKLNIIIQIASALKEIHDNNMCHRDIKPGNILVDSDRKVKITDFGTCHIPTSELTLENHALGTPYYLAPEYFVDGQTGPSLDIYALGVLSYEMLLGQHPFEAEEMEELIQKIVHQKPINPKDIMPKIPQKLDNALAKMLAKNPKRRYQKIDHIIEDLQTLSKPEQVTDKIRRLFRFNSPWKKGV